MSESDPARHASDKAPVDSTVSFREGIDGAQIVTGPSSWPVFPDHDILGQLGAGGMGVVYKARDRQRDTVVALKTLLHYGAADLYRFKQEFRALADLTHPNLVMLFQLLSAGGQWYFTMELVEGQDFLSALCPAASPDAPTGAFDPLAAAEPSLPTPSEQERGQTCDEDRLRDGLRQLADGLNFLHARDKLHCDLKPSNVMVERGGRVVILDFGLVQETAEPPAPEEASAVLADGPDATADMQLTWTRGDAIRGTIGYMSPEQAAGRQLSPASDWYAVGVMLYQALSGRLPFRGGFEVLRRKQTEDPPPPSAFAASVPPDLEALCLELLRRDPSSRPAGREVLDRLGRTPPEANAALPTAFVGREAQLALLRQAATDAAEGHARLVLVPGSSGAGKSTLLHRFFGEVSAAGSTLVLHGRCYEQETVPFKAVDALVDHLSHTLKGMPDEQVAGLLPVGVLALAQMFPVLQRVSAVVAVSSQGTAAEGPELRRQAFVALRKLLAGLARLRPLALWVDDLQWGDLDSAELLASLLQGPEPPPVLFVLSYRGEYLGTSHCLRTLFQLLDENGGVPRQQVPVEPLTLAESLALARKLLGLSATPAQAERIARESSGNPYFIHELVLHARAGEEETGASAELDEVIWSRVCRLPDPARALLEVLAVAGQPLQQGIACRVSSLHGDERRSMGLLRSANLVRSSGPRPEDEVETFHDRIRESVSAHLPREVLRRHHEQLALTLENAPGTAPERLANHFAGAGQAARAGAYFAQAGAAAARALAFELAASMFRRALEQGTADDTTIRGLRQQLGDALANAGRGTEAAEAYLSAAQAAPASQAMHLRGLAGSQLLFAGRTDEGLEVLQDVLASVGMKPRVTILGTLLSLRWHQFKQWLSGLAIRRRAEADLSEDDRRRLDITWGAARGLSIVDPVRGYELHTRGLRLALQLGEPTRVARALAIVAGHMSAEGVSKRGRLLHLLDTADKLAHESGQPYALAIVVHNRAIAHFDFAEFPQALTDADSAEAIYHERCTGVSWELDTMRTFALWTLGYLGDVVELRRRQEQLVKDARERNARYALTNFLSYTTLFAPLAADDVQQALAQLEAAHRGWTPHGYYVQTHALHVGQILVDFYLDRPQAVWDLLREHWRRYRRAVLLHIQIIRTFLLHARGAAALALAGRTASPGSWLRAAAKDARRLAKEGTPWASALGRLLHAGIGLREGRIESSVSALEQAVAQFDALGTQLHAAAARRRLAEIVGGDRARRLLQLSAECMTAQQVRDPERLTALLTPGLQAD